MKNFKKIEGLTELSFSETKDLQGGGFIDGMGRLAHDIGYAAGVAFGAVCDAVEYIAKSLPW